MNSVADSIREAIFVEVPKILMIRLMSKCNNRCIFCMAHEEIRSAEAIDFQEAVGRILAQPAGKKIDFFGGEPTIYARFLDLLRLARENGYECSIATNGRVFASQKFTARVAELDPRMIYIRTSLYGDTPELHDYYTGCRNSYRQTVTGIRNIVQAGFRSQVNIVIMAENVGRLPAMTELVAGWGVPRIKFGNLIEVGPCQEHAVRFSQVQPHLITAITLAERLGLTVTVEKTPICVADGRIDLMSTERQFGQWERCHDDHGECRGCLVRRWCEGLDPEYVALFGYQGIKRLADISRQVLKGSIQDSREPEFLKIHCVGMNSADFDDWAIRAIEDLRVKVEDKLGWLAVFPGRYLRP